MSGKFNGYVFHVISHTHWDREWYCSFQNFRMKLVKLIDNLLDILETDEDFKVFHMDAQTLILKDYLEIRPENEERLKNLIKSGRILIGPWYIQNDENLVSGESTIRNLLYGARLCEEFGAEPMKVGYLPDQFGHISQMPQILRGFGIDNFVAGRGFDARKHGVTEYIWEGADDSQLLAICMAFWYNNAQRFPEEPEKTLKILERIKKNFEPLVGTRHLLLMNGVDHLEAQENLSSILKSVAPLLEDGDVFIQSTLPAYIDAVRKEIGELITVKGELREGLDGSILAGTLSSRVHLKQLNDECELLLEKWAEPTTVWTRMANIDNNAQRYLDVAWTTLLENHPHDSICGCSIDRVHRDMLQRFSDASEIAKELVTDNLDKLNSLIDKTGFGEDDYLITIYNPNNARSNQVIEVDIPFLARDNVRNFAILGPNGEDVEYEPVGQENISMMNTDPINLPSTHRVHNTRVRFVAENIPAFGYASYRVATHAAGKTTRTRTNASHNQMENEFLKVSINPNGSIDLYDKESDTLYKGLLVFEDMGEAGDSYIYVTPINDKIYTTHGCQASISKLVDSELVQTFRIELDWDLPKEISYDYKTRSDETVTCKIRSELTLKKNSKLIEVKTTTDNKACDHRLRVLFPTDLDTDYSYAGSQFDIVKRHWSYGSEWNRYANTQPNHKFVDVNDSKKGLAVINLGLHEYELLGDPRRTLALTLLRCTDRVTFTDPEYPLLSWMAPDGQCLGVTEFNYAIYPHKGDHLESEVYKVAEQHLAGLNVVVTPLNRRKWVEGRPWVQDTDIDGIFFRPNPLDELPRLPRERSFLKLQGDNVLVSTIKKNEKNNNVILRIFNVSEDRKKATLKLSNNIANAWLVTLAEERIEKLDNTEHTVTLSLGPKKIVTVELELA